jgi:hypothetical protein
VSKRSEAKKARRRKRQSAKGPRWTTGAEDDLAVVDDALVTNGWEFDVEYSTDEMATWFYPPSGIDTDDEAVESVTRIWLTEDDEWHVILVGSGPDGVDYVFAADSLLDNLEAIEAYRPGGPAPEFE